LASKSKTSLTITSSDGKEYVKVVFVAIDQDETIDLNGLQADYFGSWVYTKEHLAHEDVNYHNNDL